MTNLIPTVKKRVKSKIQIYPELASFLLKYATAASTFMTLRPL